MTVTGFIPTQDQKQAIELMLSGANVFLTGRAGTGKSKVLQAFTAFTPGVALLAPTGLAALHLGGTTIHRFLGLPTCVLPPGYVPLVSQEQRAVVEAAKTIVIDEVSMVRADVFSAVDSTLRALASPGLGDRPFGGKQIIVVGDFGQLPPVVTCAEDLVALRDGHGGVFAFQTRAWSDAQFQVAVLRQPHRHATDPEFASVLDAVRTGTGGAQGEGALGDAVAWINRSVAVQPARREVLTLCLTRDVARFISHARDAELGEAVRRLSAITNGKFAADFYPTEPEIVCRVGSRVMLVANRLCGGVLDFANGNTGVILGFRESGIDVLLDCGRIVSVGPWTWLNREFDVGVPPGCSTPAVVERVVGSFVQYPIMLAYAITVHKAQGMSLDAVHVDLERKTFASGQLYTALSRCRSRRGLSLERPIRMGDVVADPAVCQFLAEHGL